jgi:hypothetical protein
MSLETNTQLSYYYLISQNNEYKKPKILTPLEGLSPRRGDPESDAGGSVSSWQGHPSR